MRANPLSALVLVPFLLALTSHDAEGQIFRRLKDAAASAAEGEATAKVEGLARTAVQCVVGDIACIDGARKDGKQVVLLDATGKPIPEPDAAGTDAPSAGPGAAAPAGDKAGEVNRPGEGVWANYDFVPGDKVLFYEDFTSDRVGDFPRRMEFESGNWEVVEWRGRRLLRGTGPRHASLKIILPKALPARFTIETEVYYSKGGYALVLAPAPPPIEPKWTRLTGNYFKIGAYEAGVANRKGPQSVNKAPELADELTPVRIHADGQYVRMYIKERRVANMPNAELRLSEELWLSDVDGASADAPLYIGPIRIAEGGTDLYQRLSADGRVATQGILFALNSATIQPESTPTLREIGDMLQKHGELRLRIEGHTDSTGDDAANLQLSQERADAVRDFLVRSYQIDPRRLETAGLGETKPVDSNTSPEGRQNNRRVELVRLTTEG